MNTENRVLKILIITTVKIGFDGLTNHILSYVYHMYKSDLIIDLVSARGIDDTIISTLNKIGFNKIVRLEYRDKNPLKYYQNLKKLIKNEKYDIVHAHGNSATLSIDLLAAKHAKCKVRIAHSHNTKCDHKLINSLLKPFFKHSYTHGFACGEEAGRWMFGKSKFYIIKNAKDIDRFLFSFSKRIEFRKKLGLNDDTIAVGNVAAFVGKKNHLFLIDTFNLLLKKKENYELFLFGIDGDSLEAVLKRIDVLNLKDKIHYMGTKDNIEDYLNAMDLMVLPSLFEGFPVSVLEWQINGLKCLISDTITNECDILGNALFLRIDCGLDIWADAILNADVTRSDVDIKSLFVKAGFDIKTNSNELKNLYKTFVSVEELQ